MPRARFAGQRKVSTVDDITALILDDHAAFRRGFARLDDARDEQEMLAIWDALALHLDIHAEAEEAILYPHLVKHGDDGEDETDDAIGDHNKIRDAIAEAKLHPVGSDQWWEAVGTARRENSEHLAEEEDEALPDFRRHASTELRAELGQRWLTFYGEHKNGRDLTVPRQGPAAVRAPTTAEISPTRGSRRDRSRQQNGGVTLRAALAPLVAGTTWRRGVFLLLGGVLALPYGLLAVTFAELLADSAIPRPLVYVAAGHRGADRRRAAAAATAAGRWRSPPSGLCSASTCPTPRPATAATGRPGCAARSGSPPTSSSARW